MIAGKLPDPKVGSSLSELMYGFDKVGDTVTVYQNDPNHPQKIDPANPSGFLFEMKIQLTKKASI